ncbi:TRM11 family methyltransferase [Roseiflexus castenholzii]|uniref:site-specific DNA-methyltransferase (cytosine-N(4)-specific) n=1 Tax=Roseiflexus castenholzii (strain DSM 13941 / HLO8) TaxID=383372 RepID=A7NFI4_ROSCS|nr:hypothetical protein [Roseiflexus castenholzii]ABU56206.1 hypothetical protein Rcas_0068 [Roseiflexus castenholzii DSM 13941]
MAIQRALNLDFPGAQSDAPLLRDPAFEQNKQDAIHRWVPWIAGFSAGFVSDALQQYLPDPGRRDVHVLDPFAGIGTTLVESLRRGYHVTGIEINPFAALASRVKCSAFTIEPDTLLSAIRTFEREARERTDPIDAAFERGDDLLQCTPAPRSRPPVAFRSRTPFFSPAVEQKILHCLDLISDVASCQIRELMSLALGSILVQVSNYSYEPSLGSRVAAGKTNVLNADVVSLLSSRLRMMYHDVMVYRDAMMQWTPLPTARVIEGDSRLMPQMVKESSVDIVITSPPYLNNYHYVRNTRPHLFWFGFVSKPSDLKRLEQANFGKYWQTVRNADPSKLQFELPGLSRIIEEITLRNPQKHVYGGKGWANYAIEYFNDCYTLCQSFYRVLRKGTRAIVVLGNSIIQGVNFPTDLFFGQIGELCHLKLDEILPLRKKRVGNSIINSSVRNGGSDVISLYEAAVILRRV